jgi:amino acid adenylation domain-containing protein
VRPNELVAVVLEKGWQQAVATLGILAAGAAYVPLDPALPRDRLWHLLATTRARIALTGATVRSSLEWPAGVELLVVEEMGAGEDGGTTGALEADAAPPACAATPGNLAYVLFTSGSTGVPKGVMIDHRGAVNTVLDINRRFGIAAGDRVLALSSLSFDLSVWDLFGVLGAGGAVVMPEPSAQPRPRDWVRLAAERAVTVWNSVPALLELGIDEMARGGGLPPALRLVMLSGDWIAVSLPDRLRALAPAGGQPQIVSLGGATEASIWSIHHPIAAVAAGWRSIPYGTPLANQTVHVLGERLEARPDWVPGMLYLGGIGLAQGYWCDEEKSRLAFLHHPVTGERLYRTGDLVQHLADGAVGYLGRIDDQIKLHGYRIELAEIEVALRDHPAVRAAAAAAVDFPSGGRQLVAYVVPAPAPADAATPAGLEESLRHHLRRQLPDFMVPSRLRLPGGAAADRQRQTGSPRPASGPRGRRRWRGADLPRDRGRGSAGADLGRSAGARGRSGCTRTSSLWAATPCWLSKWRGGSSASWATRWGSPTSSSAPRRAPWRA